MLPIELIMIIYEYSNCKEKSILNQCFKLNYKKFNPILSLPLKLLSSNTLLSFSYELPTVSITGDCYINVNERQCNLGNTINSLKKENRRLNNKIDYLILLLEQKHNIVIPEIDI